MKRISFLFLAIILASIVISSCTDTVTYAEQLKAEKVLIADFIKRKNINVISAFPANKIWGPNDYVLTSTGLYFHLVDSGDTKSGDTLAIGDNVVPRYYEYTLDAQPDTLTRNWTTIDYPNPSYFKFGDTTQSCQGFQEAAKYLHLNNARALIIIPTKIGFYSTTQSVIPYCYDIKIKISK